MGEIYKITHIESGKVYIGQTTRTTLVRWQEHLDDAKYRHKFHSHFLRALRKYGPAAFSVEAIETVDDASLSEREIYWIATYGTYGDSAKGYNDTPGGDCPPSRKGHKHSDAAKEKNRQAHIGLRHPHSTETKQKLSEMKKGIPFSDEHKQALAEAWKTRPPRKLETTEKMKKSSTGKINIKRFRVVSLEGEEIITERGLTDFCRSQDIDAATFYGYKGKDRPYRGWFLYDL